MLRKPTTGIIVFEKAPHWGPELKRQFQDRWLAVREVRSLPDLESSLAEFDSCLAVVQVDDDPAGLLRCLEKFGATHSHLPIVAIAPQEYRPLEWVLRESGVVAWIDDDTPGPRLAQVCLRQLSSHDLQVSRLPLPGHSATTPETNGSETAS